MQGQFITLDGIDGSGKSTACDFIRTWFDKQNIELVCTREPGGTDIGESIRTQLLDIKTQISLETETLLIFAARQQHMQEVIIPQLKQGKWVLSDRFTDATYAYQGFGRGLSIDKIRILESWVQQSFQPDLTILLDTPVSVSMSRVSDKDRDRIECEGIEFFERVRAGYLAQAKSYPDRYQIVSSYQPITQVTNEIAMLLQVFLHKVRAK